MGSPEGGCVKVPLMRNVFLFPLACLKCMAGRLDRFESAVRVAALREAHVARCVCYWDSKAFIGEKVDPRCERMRAGS